MQKKIDAHVFGGLQQDLDPHKHKPEFLVDAKNIRITNRGDNTSFAITAEKSTQFIYLDGDRPLHGKYLGHCVLNKYVVVFTHAEYEELKDKIYRLEKTSDTSFTSKLLYEGVIGFDLNHPIKTLGFYENENIQKVYWTDGLNQPRVINIIKESFKASDFEFSPSLQLIEKVVIQKDCGATGSFPAGVLQYCFTYYNKYGQETNIVWQSQLLYTSFADRAGSPEETVSNAFTIKIQYADAQFDFIRLYSIMRTSLNATPTVKRVADIDLSNISLGQICQYTDNGMSGDIIDPAELLYKGGEDITAKTICQKSNTLFLGNLKLNRPSLSKIMSPSGELINIRDFIRNQKDRLSTILRPINNSATDIDDDDILKSPFYPYSTSLNSYAASDSGLKLNYFDNASTFKRGEYYRFGVQFQYKNGKWSEPVFIGDFKIGGDDSIRFPKFSSTDKLLAVQANLDLKYLIRNGYKKARGVVVFPTLQDRRVITQGILCPTVYSIKDRTTNSPYAQSSWFIRPFPGKDTTSSRVGNLQYAHDKTIFGGSGLGKEIQGIPFELGDKSATSKASIDVPYYTENNVVKKYTADVESSNAIFAVDQNIITLHSADIEWDEDLSLLDLNNTSLELVGRAVGYKMAADTSLQTSSATITSKAEGFNKWSVVSSDVRTLGAGFYYSDYLVNLYNNQDYKKFSGQSASSVFEVFPWHKSGSLNNDVIRPADKGTRSSVLKQKKLSNIKIFNTDIISLELAPSFNVSSSAIFNFDQVVMVKLKGKTYYGNIDTLITPPLQYGPYFTLGEEPSYGKTKFSISEKGIIKTTTDGAYTPMTISLHDEDPNFVAGTNSSDVGSSNDDLRTSRGSIRMKYKSGPHLVLDLGSTDGVKNVLPSAIGTVTYPNQNLYIGQLVRTDHIPTFGGTSEDALKANLWIPAGDAVLIEGSKDTTITWKWGDTFYQRYDFLKTYAFTQEDENSVIEIGSFLGEFRVNADGRYDRNRGQNSNLNMSPQNFNLRNPVYDQPNNFFNYRIMDEDYYTNTSYPNSITWSLEKTPSAEVDNWTHITMSSVIDLDGNKGNLNALKVHTDTIYAFQDTGISNVLFNNRVQVPTSDGVPIEISNNYKVDGYRYITESIGCANDFAICSAPSSLYFIDCNSKDLYSIGNSGLINVSGTHNMSNWFKKQNINEMKLYYDFSHNDVYVNTVSTSLNFSEILGQFVSFFDYQDASALFNMDGSYYALWIEKIDGVTELFKMFSGTAPANFFSASYPYYLSFISNLDSADTKVFTNLDIRADWVDNLENLDSGAGVHYDRKQGVFDFFDTMEVSNEYQNSGVVAIREAKNKGSNLKSKFRIHRIDIPRDRLHKLDRIRNPWAKITLTKNNSDMHPSPCILHDLSVIYYV